MICALEPTYATDRTAKKIGADIKVSPLSAGSESEVLAFLSRRPLHTVTMAGFIRDNGLESPMNRGKWFACRNSEGAIEGVALIGHATLIETATDRALEAFAGTAQDCKSTHMLLGEQQRIADFWRYYSPLGQQMRRACRESLFDTERPVTVGETISDLRPARTDEIDLVVPVQAQMAFEESGVDPLATDPKGFTMRCLRRLNLNRTWVVIRDNKLLFKADVISDTPEAIYLEGIWVEESKRRNGFGACCLSRLSEVLLENSRSICLLVNEKNQTAQRLYKKAGYRFRCTYDTIFLQQEL